MAAPTVVGVGAAASGAAAVTPAFPGGYTATADDVAVTIAETHSTDTLTPPSGWAAVTNVSVTTGTATRLWAIWRRIQAGDTAPQIADVGDHIIATMIIVRGCATSGNPWDIFGTSSETSADTTVSIPGVTTTVANCLVLAAFSTGQDTNSTAGATAWANASLTNVTERMDNWTTAGGGGGFGMATGEKATAGATGATTATLSLAANFKALMTIALKEQATGGTSALAEAATGTGSAQTPTVAVAPTATEATATATANGPTAAVGSTAGNASATGTAHDAAAALTANAEVATATGTAHTPTAAVAVNADVATATGAAFDATVSTASQTDAPAEVAAATGAAFDATVSTASETSAPAEPATGTGSAFDATVSVQAQAALAAAAAIVDNAAAAIAVNASNATASGAASDATVSTVTGTDAPAGPASATGTAFDPTIAITVNAAAATATGTAETVLFQEPYDHAYITVDSSTTSGTVDGRTLQPVGVSGATTSTNLDL